MRTDDKKLKTPWNFHPRPQFKRNSYHILNGEWQLNDSSIIVPFPPQSKLSEYNGSIPDELIYTTNFSIPGNFKKRRVILHFGAVDQIATIYINDHLVGHHEGGYLPFSFDITNFVYRDKSNSMRVVVKDDLSKDYPYGKQSANPKGMWYTPVSGIWQTVWLENVPQYYISNITLDTALNSVDIKINGNWNPNNVTKLSLNIHLPNGNILEKSINPTNETCHIEIDNPINWTPENPYLYEFIISYGEDVVESYFALRTITINYIDGVNRVCLNNKPIFLNGVLDQGYFKDGIYIPENEKEYDNDILSMKELRFNFLRKHIKVEPDYFYYACDKLGILVMQDMVNSGPYSFIRDTALPTVGFKNKKEAYLSKDNKRRLVFETQMKDTVSFVYNHPCVIAYTIFNEGWGQFNSDEMYDYLKSLDSSRLIDSTSGWFWQNKSDFDSEHIYFKNRLPKTNERPLLLSECGGYQLLIKEHYFGKKEYGYGTCKNKSELTSRIINMYNDMVIPGIKDGICGCIYTQLSDVEGEINGIYTYDRKVCKIEKNKILELSNSINSIINNL